MENAKFFTPSARLKKQMELNDSEIFGETFHIVCKIFIVDYFLDRSQKLCHPRLSKFNNHGLHFFIMIRLKINHFYLFLANYLFKIQPFISLK